MLQVFLSWNFQQYMQENELSIDEPSSTTYFQEPSVSSFRGHIQDWTIALLMTRTKPMTSLTKVSKLISSFLHDFWVCLQPASTWLLDNMWQWHLASILLFQRTENVKTSEEDSHIQKLTLENKSSFLNPLQKKRDPFIEQFYVHPTNLGTPLFCWSFIQTH